VPVLVLPWLLATAAVVLGVAGLLKLVDPGPTHRMLETLHWPSAPTLVRLLGATELVVALAVLMGSPWPAVLVLTALWALFAGTIVRLRQLSPDTPCGCIGSLSGPPTARHLVVNLLGAGVSLAALASGTGTTVLWDGSTAAVILAGSAVCVTAAAAMWALSGGGGELRPGRPA
jgi:hypothetical protein